MEPHLALHFHAVPQMHGELPNIPKGVLVRRGMVRAEELRGGVLHQVDGGERVRARRFCVAQQREIRALSINSDETVKVQMEKTNYLEHHILDGLIT